MRHRRGFPPGFPSCKRRPLRRAGRRSGDGQAADCAQIVVEAAVHLRFTPTSFSWLNLAERWFAEPTKRKLRRSTHRSGSEKLTAYCQRNIDIGD